MASNIQYLNDDLDKMFICVDEHVVLDGVYDADDLRALLKVLEESVRDAMALPPEML